MQIIKHDEESMFPPISWLLILAIGYLPSAHGYDHTFENHSSLPVRIGMKRCVRDGNSYTCTDCLSSPPSIELQPGASETLKSTCKDQDVYINTFIPANLGPSGPNFHYKGYDLAPWWYVQMYPIRQTQHRKQNPKADSPLWRIEETTKPIFALVWKKSETGNTKGLMMPYEVPTNDRQTVHQLTTTKDSGWKLDGLVVNPSGTPLP